MQVYIFLDERAGTEKKVNMKRGKVMDSFHAVFFLLKNRRKYD